MMPEITDQGTTMVTLDPVAAFRKMTFMAAWWLLSDQARVLHLHNYFYCSQCDTRAGMCVHIYVVILKGWQSGS